MSTEDIIVRNFRRSDLEDLFKVLSNPNVMKYIEPPYSMEQTEQFLLTCGLCENPLVFASERDGVFIGYVIFYEYDQESYELGWVLAEEFWGRGYASAITRSMIAKAREMRKDLVIECVPEQEITKHIALSNGFSYTGRIDHLDVYRLRMPKGDC